VAGIEAVKERLEAGQEQASTDSKAGAIR